jgi:hypothetical protein
MRKATLVNSFTKGVIDGNLRERLDLVHYYSACRSGRNCSVRPQGSIFRRPGTVLAPGLDLIEAGTKRRLRRQLEPVALTAGMVTLANGGTASKLVGQDLATADDFVSNSVTGSPFVLAEIDLGTAIDLAFVDVASFKCATSFADDALAVEYSDGVDWFAYDGRRDVRTSRRTRRFGSAPGGPGGTPVNTRYLRLVLYGASGTGAFTIGRVRVWKEKRALSPVRLVMFARAADTKYELALTDRNIDVFKDHRWVASIPVPVDRVQVARVMRAQSLDTLLLFNEDVETPVITRQGSDDEWNHAAAVFTNQPTLSPATAFAGDTNEVQELSLAGIVTSQTFVLWIDDEVTAPITFSGTGSLASDIASALGALPALAAVNPTVTLVDATTRTVRIEFDSSTLVARRWAPVLANVLADNALTPVTRIVQRGIDGNGGIASAKTGWPRCGLFHQSRLIMGGFRSAPQSVVASRTGSPYDLKTTGTLTADLAFLDTLESDQNETIYQLYIGKHLQVFTETGVWFAEARTMDATQPRNWRIATRPGIEPTVPVVFADDATLYMQSGKRKPADTAAPSRVMRELVLVSDVEVKYAAEPKNVLAPALISSAVDIAVTEPRVTDEAATGYVVNSDGTIAHLVTQKTQEVVAFLPWDTDGFFRSVGVDVGANVWVAVRRDTEAAGADLYLERFDADVPLDAALVFEFTEPTSVIPGLDHLEGKTDVWAYADGDLYGPFTVEDAEITLEVEALDVTVGQFRAIEIEPMPIRDKLSEAQPFRPPGRIYEMDISVNNSGPFDLAVNGGAAREVPVTFFGAKQADGGPFQTGGEMDLPLLDRLFTGSIPMQNLRGWSDHPRWTITQSKPARLEIAGVRSELAYKGQ